jgi:serine/threonine protein kinase
MTPSLCGNPVMADPGIDQLSVAPLDSRAAGVPIYVVRNRYTGEHFIFKSSISGARQQNGTPHVAHYVGARSGERIIVKALPHDEASYEENIITRREHECRVLMVPARIAHKAVIPSIGAEVSAQNYTVVLMPYYGEPLSRASNLQHLPALGVVYEVSQKCADLLELGLAYTDMKPANVLFFEDRGVSLCDYGSLVPVGANDGSATYPPPEYPRGTNVPANEASVVYGLGALLVCLCFPYFERHLRYVPAATEANEHLATAAVALGCRDAVELMKRRGSAASRALATAWKPGATIAGFQDALRRAV